MQIGSIFSRSNRLLLPVVAVLTSLLLLSTALLAYFCVQYYRLKNDSPADWQVGYNSGQQLQTFQLNAVAADASACTTIGSYVLNTLGGNAMDSAVATVLCVGVCNAHSTGIGGGSFLLHYDAKTKSVATYNFRETAPRASTTNMFNDLPKNATSAGGLAIAVPSEVAGLSAAHARFGRLSWRSLVLPVAELLRSGFRVAQPLADAMNLSFEGIPDRPPYRELKRWMVNPDTGRVYQPGELLKDEKLASTMEQIADDPTSFNNGSLAEKVVDEIKEAGGIVDAEDLRQYAVAEASPLSVDLRAAGLRLLSMPPPGSGAVLGFVLNLLDGFRPTPDVKESLDSYVTFLHRIVESLKFGYAKRSALADPNFVDVAELVANLTSDAFADQIRAKITDGSTHDVNYYGPSFDWRPDSGTSHVSTVDTDGNVVAVTSTINTYFGSLVKGPSTGILYNNEMDDFSVPNRTNSFGVPPSKVNFIKPGKRPMSSMAPAILTDLDGRPRFVTGGAGGTEIISAVACSLARQLYLNETVKQATDAFRLHHQLVPNVIMFNPAVDHIPQAVAQGLERKGHKLFGIPSISVVEAIQLLRDGRLQASGDHRKPSRPDGN